MGLSTLAQELILMDFLIIPMLQKSELAKILLRSEIGELEQQIIYIYRLGQKHWWARFIGAMEQFITVQDAISGSKKMLNQF
jgi:hypothetical protein